MAALVSGPARDTLAYDSQESRPGLVCVASPARGPGDQVAGALSVSGWSARMKPDRAGPAVRTATLTISRALGVVVYLITGDGQAEPATVAAWVRGHWEIENRLHWVRDVTCQEDRSLVRAGNEPRVMASLRSLAISLLRLDGHANIAAANRHHARDPQRTLKLLQAA